ncbi:MAG: PAS domain-containing protein [Nitrospiraceae bacterium]|nr:PAS domain-containing protein [Nitrospiraceae bacterium]
MILTAVAALPDGAFPGHSRFLRVGAALVLGGAFLGALAVLAPRIHPGPGSGMRNGSAEGEPGAAHDRNLLRTLVDNLPDYIYAKDADSRFILNNAAHLRLLGFESQEDVYGKTDFDIFPEELAASYYRDEHEVVRSGEPLIDREEEIVDENGERQWVLTTKVPLRDAQGKVVGSVGMSRLITKRKRMKEALARHAELLERANADLAKRNQELDEFTYIASHDLQEPLRKLSAFSEVLQQDLANGEEEEVHEDLNVIVSAAQRMQQLVQDLLALSRSGRQAMKWGEVTVDHCVDRALDVLQLRIEETGAVIERGSLPLLGGDESLLTQLFQNLIGNGLKFHGGEPPVITLSSEKIDDHWLLTVEDNGIGLKPEYAEQIFSPFKRLHGRGKYEGTGIGLAICRKIVERHNGRIWVESELGHGARFKFTVGEPHGSVT